MNLHWQNDKISNHAQLGGIETSVLDDGLARGVRIAWVNTGTGLRYKVVLDRAMDIADTFYNQYSLAWLSHTGVSSPQPFSNKGLDWLKTFGGGLLTTCGLSHVGGPEKDSDGERGLHGEISNTAASIESIRQPDPARGLMSMSITGLVKQSQALGPALEMRRTISGTIGNASISIHDEITNRGNQPAPHMLLYHCNFGWPLADEGTQLVWRGDWKPREEGPANKIFHSGNSFRTCPPVIEDHSGRGEEAAFINVTANGDGQCECGLHNGKLGLAVVIRFAKSQLPWLINWQHWGRGEYVTGLEPATHLPTGQAKAKEERTIIFLDPGETRSYDLEFEVLHQKASIDAFLKNNDC